MGKAYKILVRGTKNAVLHDNQIFTLTEYPESSSILRSTTPETPPTECQGLPGTIFPAGLKVWESRFAFADSFRNCSAIFSDSQSFARNSSISVMYFWTMAVMSLFASPSPEPRIHSPTSRSANSWLFFGSKRVSCPHACPQKSSSY